MKLLDIVEEDNHLGNTPEGEATRPLRPCLVWWGLEGIEGC